MGEPDAAVIEAERKASDQFLERAGAGAGREGLDPGHPQPCTSLLSGHNLSCIRRQAGISLERQACCRRLGSSGLEARESWQKAMAPLNATLGL